MDGVADVSRPPIPPGEDFTYEFTATPAGTHWYHSHTGVQYSDGLFGPLIVDEPAPPAKYDREAIVLVNDWFLQQSDAILAGLIKKPDMKSMTADAHEIGGRENADGFGKIEIRRNEIGDGSPKTASDATKKSDAPADTQKSGMAGMAMGKARYRRCAVSVGPD